MKREELKSIFDALRNDPQHHLGLGDIRLTIAQQDEILAMFSPLPPAEGAEEILASIVESLGEPINIHNHIFEIRPYTVDHKTEWWIFHKEVGSGEPLKQWLGNFATLHAQKIADKKVSERLREELAQFDQWTTREVYIGSSPNIKACYELVDEYLKSR